VTLLDETTVGEYARARGLISGGPTRCVTLAGGVSNIVLLVENETALGIERVVVKQALATLRVAVQWKADPARSQAEAAALRVLHQLTPDVIPAVLDADPDRDALAIDAAPDHWVMWKSELLRGVVQPQIAARLGSLLGGWHRATDQVAIDPVGNGPSTSDRQTGGQGVELPDLLERTDLFEQLRLAPYFGTAADRRPALAANINAVANRVRQRRRCLVLGDFSPKNILVASTSDVSSVGATTKRTAADSDALWIIDLEVAHCGDPSFDVAFLLTHLVAKSVHLPALRPQLLAAARMFVDRYVSSSQATDGTRGTSTALSPGLDDETHVAQLLGALLVARVAGSSPLEYLSVEQQQHVEALGVSLLTNPAARLADVLGES
jgi:5-methylthioribose kinase